LRAKPLAYRNFRLVLPRVLVLESLKSG
jgi:hypothetical protein